MCEDNRFFFNWRCHCQRRKRKTIRLLNRENSDPYALRFHRSVLLNPLMLPAVYTLTEETKIKKKSLSGSVYYPLVEEMCHASGLWGTWIMEDWLQSRYTQPQKNNLLIITVFTGFYKNTYESRYMINQSKVNNYYKMILIFSFYINRWVLDFRGVIVQIFLSLL